MLYLELFLYRELFLYSVVCVNVVCLKRKSNRGVWFKIIAFGLFGILIPAGLTALGLSTSVDEGFEGFICSFDTFFEHTFKGEDKPSETSSKWIGLNNIETELNDILIKMNSILSTLSNNTDIFHTNFKINSTKVHNLLNTKIETNINDPSNLDVVIDTDYSLTFSQSFD